MDEFRRGEPNNFDLFFGRKKGKATFQNQVNKDGERLRRG